MSALHIKGSDSPRHLGAIFVLIHRVEEIQINRWAKCGQDLNKSQLQNHFCPLFSAGGLCSLGLDGAGQLSRRGQTCLDGF